MNIPRLVSVSSTAAARTRQRSWVAATPDRFFQRASFSGTVTGGRGSRGHGWYTNYRAGKGGRHLQGEYFDRDLADCQQWNDAIFQLGSQQVYMDVVLEPISSNVRKPGQVPKLETLEGEKHRLLMDVASRVMAETSQNFIDLCHAEEDGYAGTLLYRFLPQLGISGGDVLTNTGKTGKAAKALGLTQRIELDPLALWHVPGTVTMVVKSVEEIDSRFIFCTDAAPHLDGIYRAFGRLTPESLSVVQGWQSKVLTRNGVPTSYDLVVVGGGLITDEQESETAA